MSTSTLPMPAIFIERRKGVRLRNYQQNVVDSVCQAFDEREQFVLVQAATGAGKTIIFSHLIKRLLENEPFLRIAVIAHRRELIAQAQEKMLKVYPEAPIGIACASLEKKKDMKKNITIGTIQTLANQSKIAPFNVIIIDEVHRLPTKDKSSQMGQFLLNCLERNPGLKVLGVTATPYRLGHGYIFGKLCKNPYGNWFSKKVATVGVEKLQKEKFLCPYTYMVTDQNISHDLAKVSLNSFGEYSTEDLERTVTRTEHLYSAVHAVKKHAQGRRSIVIFCVSITHAKKMKEIFQEEGLVTEAIHSEMEIQDRDEILDQFNKGQIRVLTNVNVLTEGWDSPRADCVMLCRPTMSPALYVQMVGRGLRTFEGKKECLVLDLAGCFERHGGIKNPVVKHYTDFADESNELSFHRKCPECSEMIPMSAALCPHCNLDIAPEVEYVDEAQEMVVIDDSNDHMLYCEECQVPYNHSECNTEIMEYDQSSEMPGLIYCPQDHLVKAMGPVEKVKEEGEYLLDHVCAKLGMSSKGVMQFEIECFLLNNEFDMMTTQVIFQEREEDIEILKEWIDKLAKNKIEFTDLIDLSTNFRRIDWKLPAKVRIALTPAGSLLSF